MSPPGPNRFGYHAPIVTIGRRTLGGVLAVVLAIVLVLPAVAAADRTAATGHAASAAVAVERVRIVDFAFRPRRVTVERGTRVRWVNRGAVAHTSTSTKGLWDSGLLAQGEGFTRVFRKAGTFRYLCTVHPAMTGRIVVT